MSRGIQRFTSMGGFSKHRKGGGKFLSKWKEKGTIDVWLHTKELPIAVYRHQLPMVIIREDKNDRSKKERRVWSKKFVCHETPETIEAQYFRERDTAARKSPPERCGICKLVEWAYQQALAYEETRDSKKPKGLSFVTPLFKFVSDESDETTILHVGGLCNLFGKKDLSDPMKADMKEAKISPKNAWKENAHAKCEYAMRVVDSKHVDGGLQIAVESGSLGEKIKEVLDAELENEIDIQKTPYLIRWKYNEKETDLNKKYNAVAIRKTRPDSRVLGLIRGEAPPLPDDITTPFNQQSMRSILERACVLPNHEQIIPWDELFPSKEQSEAWAKEDAEEEARQRKLAASEDEDEDEDEESDDEDEDEESDDEDEDEDEGDDEDEEDEDEEDEDEEDEESDDEDEEDEESDDEEDEDEEDEFACDACGKATKASDTKCPHCGVKLDAIEKPEEEKPKSKMKSRTEARASKGGGSGGSSKTKSKGSTKVKPSDDEGEGEGENDADGVPF